jgi:putative SOS response-associated peptidase YedK
MCGRFNLSDPRDIEERFGFFDWHEKRIEPRFNIAPSQEIVTVVQLPEGARSGQLARWGFAPFWADPRVGPPPINARAESLAQSPMFREALASGRCLIPASGFYEWQTQPGTGLKVPMHVRLKSGELFAFAGLWVAGKREGLPSAAIVTCRANAMMATIHTRMPAILRREDEERWLDPSFDDPLSLLVPYAADDLEAYPVAPLVNSVANDGPALVAQVAPPPAQLSLF